MSDLDRRDDELTERLELVAKGSVLSTRTALKFFLVLAGLLLLALGGILRITSDTRRTVDDEVRVLERRNTELEEQHAVDEDLLNQSTDAIVLLINTLQENGIEPPEIVIRPSDEGG